MLVGEIAKKIHIASSKAKIEERKIEGLMLELRYKQASILRLFKRGEIERIKRRIQSKRRKIDKYSAIAENYKKLLDETKVFAEKATK